MMKYAKTIPRKNAVTVAEPLRRVPELRAQGNSMISTRAQGVAHYRIRAPESCPCIKMLLLYGRIDFVVFTVNYVLTVDPNTALVTTR
jgi:hypothetical protein